MHIERTNKHFFGNKVMFDVSPLNTAKRYRFDLKKCLINLNPILKLCIILLTKNNVWLFDSQIKILYIIQCI